MLQEYTLNLDSTRRELYPHGTIEFPCTGRAGVYTDRAADEIQWHWHNSLEIIYSAKGDMKVQIPGKSFRVKTGECIFINSSILHKAVAAPLCEAHWMVFCTDLLTGGMQTVFSKKYLGPLMVCPSLDGCLLIKDNGWQQEGIDSFAAAFEALASEKSGYEFIVREQLSRFCLLIYEQYKDELINGHGKNSPDKQRICKMVAYLHEHCAEKLTLSMIAKAADIGERECLRCFQRTLQISPMQYLLKHRIMRGAALLTEEPKSSIAEVSIRCGFDSPSSFSRMFRRYFMCTPKEYRNGSCSQEE